MHKGRGFKLQVIISFLLIFIVISTVIISLLIVTNSLKKTATASYLNNNYNFAEELVNSSDYQLNYMKNNMVALAEIASSNVNEERNIEIWYEANKEQFNSILIVDKDAVVQFVKQPEFADDKYSPITQGTELKTSTIKKALSEKKPMISDPYYGTSGRLITLISAPIYDEETNTYKGLAGGTIYLDDVNMLENVLVANDDDERSYVYVVDKYGRLIYHPKKERLGEVVSTNEVVREVMNRKSGSKVTTNSKGLEFFTGYSYVDISDWGIIVQTETSIMNDWINNLLWKVVLILIPFIIIVLFIGWLLVNNITKPLKKLAEFSELDITEKEDYINLQTINIRTPVYEIRQLYYQVIDRIRMLNKQSKIDGLTEIFNRSMFDKVIRVWMKENIPFSLIMLDIDHFKKVNDTYGHITGDEVLKYLTKEMVDSSSKDDFCFRYGGEEFGILMKNSGEKEAFKLAERLRVRIANQISPSGEPITVSFGVTEFRKTDKDPKMILERADEALYYSKRTGRNKTTLYQSETIEKLS